MEIFRQKKNNIWKKMTDSISVIQVKMVYISVPSISVNGEIVKTHNIPIGNLGSVFDPSMDMAAHVSKAVKSAIYYL